MKGPKPDALTAVIRDVLARFDGDESEAWSFLRLRFKREAALMGARSDLLPSFAAVSGRIQYIPETGEFVWRSGARRDRVGLPCGTITAGGYRSICLGSRAYLAHRLAWLLMTGSWPTGVIDHKNGDPGDNRWVNLRECTMSQNMANKSNNKRKASGLPVGVFERKGTRKLKYKVQIKVGSKNITVGSYATVDEAVAARVDAEQKYFGEFAFSLRRAA